MTVTILTGDAREVLGTLADRSVRCCVTSPPYFGLRNYEVAGQIGLEATPDEFVAKLVAVFREVRRVLADDGTLWLNLGDSYAGSWGAQSREHTGKHDPNISALSANQVKAAAIRESGTGSLGRTPGLKPKDLIGIPWRVAFALQADGWWLRQDIIWSKPNPMPESVTDRCTKAHEYLFLLTKRERYYFDAAAIAEPIAAASVVRLAQDIDAQAGSARVPSKTNGPMKAVRPKGNAKTFRGGGTYTGGKSFDNDAAVERDSHGNAPNETWLRNRRSVWTVATHSFKESHFATFPPDLVEPCILAGSAFGDTVIDPFFGAGTTGLVADRLGRNCIGIELNPAYAAMARSRISSDAPLFAEVSA